MLKSLFLTGALAAFEFPEGGEIMEHFPIALQQMKEENTATMPVPSHPELPASDEMTPSEKCKHCLVPTATQVMEIYVADFKKWCEKPSKCDKKKKLCKFLTEHVKALEGALLYYDKPFLVAYAYCVGANKCKAPSEVPTYVEGMQLVEAMANGLNDKMEVAESMNVQDEKDCRSRVTKKVFEAEVAWLKKVCEKPPTKLAKVCEWIHKEPEMAEGYLAAATSPWTWAAGWCAAKKAPNGDEFSVVIA